MGSRYWHATGLSFGVQLAAMSEVYPQLAVEKRKHGAAWTGPLQPTPLSRTYTVHVGWDLASAPKVNVLKPELEAVNDQKIPHRYGDGSLCLYRPGKGEWTDKKLIAYTIIPWACLWLAYYEYWRATGEWHGGGEHPDPGASKDAV